MHKYVFLHPTGILLYQTSNDAEKLGYRFRPPKIKKKPNNLHCELPLLSDILENAFNLKLA